MDLLISGGVVLLAIVVISVYAVYLFFVRLFKLSRERLDTDELMVRVNAAVRDRDLDLALDACEQHGGPVARVLQAALLRLPYGRQAVEAAFAEASLLEEQSLTRGLRPLATIAQVAPLLGLLGTVTGMIIAFGEISASGTGNPGLLAGGIGQALVTTAAGLIVAIPVLIGQNYLASRVDGILTEIDRRREELMANVVQAVAGRKEASAAAEAPKPGPTARSATPAGTAAGGVREAPAPVHARAASAVSVTSPSPRPVGPVRPVPRTDVPSSAEVTPVVRSPAASGLFADPDPSDVARGPSVTAAGAVSSARSWGDDDDVSDAAAAAAPLISRVGRLRVERFDDADQAENDRRDLEG